MLVTGYALTRRPLHSHPFVMPRLLLIANPENRRATMFQEALARAHRPPAYVLAWEDLLTGRICLASTLRSNDVVRIESPGENFIVEQLLLKLGAEAAAVEGAPFLPAEAVQRLSFDRGLILYPRQWYLGFVHALRVMEEAIQVAGARPMNAPGAIAAMFDKRRSHAVFLSAGVPTPDALPGACGHHFSSESAGAGTAGVVGCYDELLDRMIACGWRRVFVKLAHGSSASGVIAFHRGQRQRAATTSAELVREGGRARLYNSLRVRRYTDERDIAELINTLCREGVHVERWLPKASLARGVFDLRIVVIAGRARHTVVRHGRSPMTNLHLGNARGDFQEFLHAAGADVWREVAESCQRASAAFGPSPPPRQEAPAVLYAGVDVCLTPGFRRHAVLEINAFGDLLPKVLSEGQDTYSAEIAALGEE